MKNHSSNHSCGVGASGHCSCPADPADANALLEAEPGLWLWLAGREENRRNVPTQA